MGLQKYDWTELEMEFLKSDHKQVSSFVKEKFGKVMGKDGGFAKNTKGRTEKKKMWEEELKKNAMQTIEAEIVEKWKPDIEVLNTTHKNIVNMVSSISYRIGELTKKIKEPSAKEGDNMKDYMMELSALTAIIKALKVPREMIKTEKGESTSVSTVEGEAIEGVHITFVTKREAPADGELPASCKLPLKQ